MPSGGSILRNEWLVDRSTHVFDNNAILRSHNICITVDRGLIASMRFRGQRPSFVRLGFPGSGSGTEFGAVEWPLMSLRNDWELCFEISVLHPSDGLVEAGPSNHKAGFM